MEKIVNCPYCRLAAELVTGRVIYPHRRDLHNRRFWRCKPCDAYVGTHNNSPTNKPLGSLANAETRKARMKAHAIFDPLWKNTDMTRREAYKWLADRLGYKPSECHISWMTATECQRVNEACREFNKQRTALAQ